MFIEVTTRDGKKLINTSHILSIKPEDPLKNEFSVIAFSCPVSSKGGNILIVKESYEEIKKKMM